MGMPISFDPSEDEVRTKLCTAHDCRCPDCHQRRLIRLGSLSAHQHRYSRSGQMGGIHAGYIFTDLPDYRFRHALNAETQVQAVSRESGPLRNHQRDNRGDSSTGLEAQAAADAVDQETNSSSTVTATATATAAAATSDDAAATSEAAATTAATSLPASLTNLTEVRATGTVVLDPEQQQERCEEEEGTAHGRNRQQRVRAQVWAANVEGLDYYHESDQDS
ncbi:hypothetical protein EC968_001390 [Mortierella alpina]|nr:hypothetical protein EC968_001390 [Mortierella alpina]